MYTNLHAQSSTMPVSLLYPLSASPVSALLCHSSSLHQRKQWQPECFTKHTSGLTVVSQVRAFTINPGQLSLTITFSVQQHTSSFCSLPFPHLCFLCAQPVPEKSKIGQCMVWGCRGGRRGCVTTQSMFCSSLKKKKKKTGENKLSLLVAW